MKGHSICGLRCNAKKCDLACCVISHVRAQDLCRRFGTTAVIVDSKYCKSPTGGAVWRGTPDMEVVTTDEKMFVGPFGQASERPPQLLRRSLKEIIPSRLTDLLRRLDEPDNAYSEKQQ
jgi:hypothetical protein